MATLMQGHWFAHLYEKAHGTLNPNFSRPIVQIHGHEMYFVLFAYFAFGFLLTAYPRFVEMPHPSARQIVAWVAGLFLSEVSSWLGLRNPNWFFLSAALEFFVYLTVFYFILSSFLKSKTQWRDQPRLIALALAFGLIGSTLSNLALINPNLWPGARRWSVMIGLYGYITLLIFGITWRVVPFFSSRVLPGYAIHRGKHSGTWVLICIFLRIILEGLSIFFPAHNPSLLLATWMTDSLLLVVLAMEIIKWRPWAARKFPPLFILYLGLTWLLLFLSFSPIHLFAHFFSPTLETFLMMRNKDLLHIFNIGTYGTLILAIATRVTRGHGGLPLQFDLPAFLSFFLMQMAMLVRVINPHETMHYAALIWLVAFGLWAWRHLPILLQLPSGRES